MSQKTRTFTTGNATVFQDKQSEETRKFLLYMEKNTHEKTRLDILDQKSGMFCLNGLADILSEKTDAEISTVLSTLLNLTRKIQNSKKEKNAVK